MVWWLPTALLQKGEKFRTSAAITHSRPRVLKALPRQCNTTGRHKEKNTLHHSVMMHVSNLKDARRVHVFQLRLTAFPLELKKKTLQWEGNKNRSRIETKGKKKPLNFHSTRVHFNYFLIPSKY